MFDIGFLELALIGILALVVLGPKRLPEAARTAGRWVGKLRAFISDVKQDIDREIESGDLADFRRLKDELSKARTLIEESSNSIYQQVDGLAGNINQEVKGISSPASVALARKKKSPAKKKTAGKKRAVKKKPAKKPENKKAAKKKSRKRKT
ncbi:MAG: Sec-independent protein translocase protein TatB [Acidiferrobacterales bacterium]